MNPFFKKEVLESYAYFHFIKTAIPWNVTERFHGQRFTGYNFQNVESLLQKANAQLDHLCYCTMNDERVPEFW